MAVHSFNEEAKREFESANAFRAQLDKEAERHARDMYRREQEKADANTEREDQLRLEREEQRRREEAATRTLSDNIMRGARSSLKDDKYGREAYNTFIEFSALRNANMVVGSLLANTAAEASYVASLEEAIKEEKTHKTNDTSIIETAKREADRTLQDYITSVEESRAALTGTSQTYHVEFEETRREAQQVQATANRAYETIKTRADEAIRVADDTYKRSLESITKDTEIAITRRDEVVHNATKSFDNEIRQIASTHSSGGEAVKLIDTATQKQQTAIETAHHEYESAVKQIRETTDPVAAEKLIESAAQVRDLAITAASKQYVADVREIAETHMDTSATHLIDSAAQRRETAIIAATQEYNTTHAQLETQRTTAVETHKQEITRQTDRIADAELKRDTVVSHQNDVIHTAQIKRDDLVASAQRELTNAQTKLALFEQSKDSIPTAALSLQRALNPIEGRSESITLQTFAQGVEQVQINIGTQMAMKMGTDEEKHILSAIMSKGDTASAEEMAKVRAISMQYAGDLTAGTVSGAYDIDARTAAKLGTDEERKFINSVLDKGDNATKEEQKQVQAIMDKYRSETDYDFGTTGCRDAVASIENFSKFLQKENETITNQIQLKTNELNDIDARISLNQAAIQKLASVQKQLETGIGENGQKLTEGQIKNLQQQLPKLSKEASDAAALVTGLTQQKNAIKASLNQMQSMKAQNTELIKGIGQQTARLKKNGKALSLQLIRSKNKKSKKLQNSVDKRSNKFDKSVDKIAREHNRKINKGDIFWEEINNSAYNALQRQRKFDKAIAISAYVRTIGAPTAEGFKKGFRLVGKQTGLTNLKNKAMQNTKLGGWVDKNREKKIERLQQKKTKDAEKLKAENAKRAQKGKKGFSSVEEMRNDKIRNVLGWQNKLRNKPKEIIRAQTLKLGKATTRKIGGALGKTKVGKWAAKTFSPAAQALKKFQQRLQKLNPMNLLNKVKEKIIGWILSALGSIFSFVAQIAGYILAAVGLFIVTFLIIVIALLLIFAAIAAILNFFQKMGSEHQALVKNDPSFMLEQAVNYRNSELEILEMFKSDDPETWEAFYLTPSNDPFYNAMTYRYGDSILEPSTPNGTWEELDPYNSSLSSWYINTRMPTILSSISNASWKTDNQGRYSIKVQGPDSSVSKTFSSSGLTADQLKSIYNDVLYWRNYDHISMQYYNSEALASGTQYGNYTLKSNAEASNYEISNAKDALSATDAIYTNKEDTMQRFEVLAYLGVGKYQLAEATNNQPLMNLFWASHKPIYLSGTSADDAWYHKTNNNGTVAAWTKWDGTSASTMCDSSHQATITQTYQQANMQHPHANAAAPGCYYYEFTKSTGYSYKHTSGSSDLSKDSLYHQTRFMTKSSKVPSGFTTKETAYKGNDLNNIRKNYARNEYNTLYLSRISSSAYGSTYRVYNASQTRVVCDGIFISKYGNNKYITNFAFCTLTWNSSKQAYTYREITSRPSSTASATFADWSNAGLRNGCQCAKVETGKTSHDVTTTICLGHIDLKMAMVVSSIGGDKDGSSEAVQDAFLNDAARVTPVPPGSSKGNFLFTSDTQADIFGFGSIDVEPFNPAEDFAEDSQIRKLAKGKANLADEKYELENSSDDPSANCEYQYHMGSTDYYYTYTTSFKRLQKSPQNTLLYGLAFGDRVFYMESYVSGEQKDLPFYEYSLNSYTIYKVSTPISIKISASGKPYIQ